MEFERLNALGKERKPFFFLTDFSAHKVEAYPLEELRAQGIFFCIDETYQYKHHPFVLEKNPVSFGEYLEKFSYVQEKIRAGDTYMLNLTQPTKIATPLTLAEIYAHANAHYKLLYKDRFVCFSPEKFIQIKNNTIHTFPMKGTIDASIEHAKEKILADAKESAEHVMVVDLLRNDLSIVAKNVRVERFRYVHEIEAGVKKLLQVSSHICGDLEDSWHERVGDILRALLPAGSVSGTPKKSTVDIIQNIEGYERGFYCGVFGMYDGTSLESGVMIRFIEKTDEGLVYKSGGGITIESDARSEYNELLDKVYLP